jgi:hypothetical protein
MKLFTDVKRFPLLATEIINNAGPEYFLLDTIAADGQFPRAVREAAAARSKQFELEEKKAGTWYPNRK